jgi:His-Xaa-Ser system protein HxsD
MKAEIENHWIRLLIEKELYSEQVLHKCFYWYGGDFDVEIAVHSEDLFEVTLRPTNLLADLTATVGKVKRDLIDFRLREIVERETRTVRELLVAKAFAYYGIDDTPQTEITDPVGFNPDA